MGSEIEKRGHWSYFAATGLSPQVERLALDTHHEKIQIGLPKESTLQENRVALVPSSVASLVGHGHHVVVERGAGEKSSFTDQEYSEAGAELVSSPEHVYESGVVIKVVPPTTDEACLLKSGNLLISPLQIPMLTKNYIQTLLKKQVNAIAMEYMMDSDGTFPVVRIMSEMAGISAMLTAAELLTNTSGGSGVLLGGISGVPPAKVVILGAGVVGEFASRTALGLGAQVSVFDNNIYKLMRIQQRVSRHLFTSSFNPVYLEKEILTADVVIGAIHAQSGRSPMVVSEDLVRKMRPGTVIIDVSIDQGGCIETSELTTHEQPTFIKHGVIHYCVPNIASRVARTGSVAVSNIMTPILLNAGSTSSVDRLFYENPGLMHGVYTYKGRLTNEYIANRFNLRYTDLRLMITTGL